MAEQTKTIKCKVLSHGENTFEQTLIVYREALSFIVDVIDSEFNSLGSLSTKSCITAVEKLIHRTKSNPSPKYDFSVKFYKFPSYFRRSAISKAFGIVKSYRSNLENWKEEREQVLSEGKNFKKKPPVLSFEHKAFPVFYKNNMFNQISKNEAQIKVFKNNDWVWETVVFNDKNLKNRVDNSWKENNPTLIKVGKKYFLNFSYSKKISLHKTKLRNQVIVAVDLGLTNSAVCSAMRFNGTVIGRKFINQPLEKDRLKTKANKLKKAQSQSGKISAPHFWRKINGLQKHIINNTSSEIIKFAETFNADVIVFEYLGKMKIPKGYYGSKKLRHKLHHWCKLGIQNKVEEMAHYRGMRIRRVNAKYTSALAFDGSGELTRNSKKDLAVFRTGKVYHADLNATYNIGARYFIREFLKSFSEKKRLYVEAKVPSLTTRTRLTLASFISLHQALSTEGAKQLA
ncbi:RNA-guided endonuclease TnpB family protein [Bacillus paralicheniformis]|uniref:RNA-guided endonuclease TnpB family protein n=1 Tax=Bacillus paralicheniformis TaxID=1648923 RepID=UPI0034D2D73E